MQITFPFYSEWNCSSKFIGPIPVPWEETSEKNKTMLLPIQVKLPTPAIIAPVNATIASAVPKMTMPSTNPIQAANTIPPAYKQLFGANTLTAYSPIANITNVN